MAFAVVEATGYEPSMEATGYGPLVEATGYELLVEAVPEILLGRPHGLELRLQPFHT